MRMRSSAWRGPHLAQAPLAQMMRGPAALPRGPGLCPESARQPRDSPGSGQFGAVPRACPEGLAPVPRDSGQCRTSMTRSGPFRTTLAGSAAVSGAIVACLGGRSSTNQGTGAYLGVVSRLSRLANAPRGASCGPSPEARRVGTQCPRALTAAPLLTPRVPRLAALPHVGRASPCGRQDRADGAAVHDRAIPTEEQDGVRWRSCARLRKEAVAGLTEPD